MAEATANSGIVEQSVVVVPGSGSKTGASVSLEYDIVCDAIPVFPQASVTVQFLVVENKQPDPVSDAIEPEAMRPVVQLSLTEAFPKAAAISDIVGLQPMDETAASVITGNSVSFTITVLLQVELHPVMLEVWSVRKNEELQSAPEITVTVCEDVLPEIEPFPEIVHE